MNWSGVVATDTTIYTSTAIATLLLPHQVASWSPFELPLFWHVSECNSEFELDEQTTR